MRSRGIGVVGGGNDDLAGISSREQRGDPDGVGDVGGDHQTGGIRVIAPDIGQSAVGLLQDRRQPLTLDRQRGAQPLIGPLDAADRRRRWRRRSCPSGAHPLHVAVEAGEEHRADHAAVVECLAVAVLVVGHGLAVIAEAVVHERDRVVVGAKRGARQQQPASTRRRMPANTVAPGPIARRMVDLVEDHEGAPARARATPSPTDAAWA